MTGNNIATLPSRPAAVPGFAIGDLERIARAIAGSKLFGVQNEDQALALCLVAQAEGRHPALAAQDYHIISGRPSKKADAMLRDLLASGGRVEWHALDDARADATFSHPAGGTVRIAWDMERAKAAQVLGNAMWKKYPRQMLRSRCVSEGVRTVCPGATSGMYEPGEVADFAPPPEPVNVTPVADDAPARRSAAQMKRDGDWERITNGFAAAKTEAALVRFLNRDDVQAVYAALSPTWREQVDDRYAVELDRVRAPAPVADPYGLHHPAPDGDFPADWTAWLDVVVGMIDGAPSTGEVREVQVVNRASIDRCAEIVNGVQDRIAEAVERRYAALEAADGE